MLTRPSVLALKLASGGPLGMKMEVILMPRGRPLATLVLSDEERSLGQVRRHRIARSMRCRMILRCSDGLKAVAAELGVHERTVGKWRQRFLEERVEGLFDEPGRPRTIEDEKVVVERTLTTTPTDATHWSLRSMAKEAHRSGAFFQPAATSLGDIQTETRTDKVRDHLSPPDRALVLCVDEKSQGSGSHSASSADAAGHAANT